MKRGTIWLQRTALGGMRITQNLNVTLTVRSPSLFPGKHFFGCCVIPGSMNK